MTARKEDEMEVDSLDALKQEYYQGKHIAEPVKEIEVRASLFQINKSPTVVPLH